MSRLSGAVLAFVGVAGCHTSSTHTAATTAQPSSTGVSSATTGTASPAAAPALTAGFAVVELFTSEGCSSCPPADSVLAALDARAPAEAIYTLSFHVDYWNRLGWTDPYSQAVWSERQRAYAPLLGERSVYTPQTVVNGVTSMVGSRSLDVARAVAAAIAAASTVGLRLDVAPAVSRAVRVRYEVSDAPAGATLEIALVERSATSHVLSGENGGETLRHVNVVRTLTAVSPVPPRGVAELTLPVGLAPGNAEIIAFIEQGIHSETDGRPIIAAARASIAGETPR